MLQLNDYLKKINYDENSKAFQIYYWSLDCCYDEQHKQNLYNFYFLTHFFKQSLKQFLNKIENPESYILRKSQLQQYIDLFISNFINHQNSGLNLSTINSQNIYIQQGSQLVYLQHKFFEKIFEFKVERNQRMTKIQSFHQVPSSCNNQIIQYQKDQFQNKIISKDHPFENIKITFQPNLLIKKFEPQKTNRRSISFMQGQKSMRSSIKINNLPIIKKQQIIAEKSYKYKQEISIRDRIFNFGIFLFELSTYQDSSKLTNTQFEEILDSIHIKYTQRFCDFIKKLLNNSNEFQSFEDIQKYSNDILGANDAFQETQMFQNQKNIFKINLKHMGLNFGSKTIIQKHGNNFSDSIFIHHFIEDTKTILIIYITKSLAPFYEERILSINFQIPKKSTSFTRKCYNNIAQIFLIGGINNNNILILNENNNQLEKYAEMTGKNERHSFGICYINQNMFAFIGGYIDGEMTSLCELFYIDSRKYLSLPKPCCDMSLCNYNGQFLYKFGGYDENLNFCQSIEKYDFEKNNWHTINIINQNSGFKFYKNQLSFLINPLQIFIFGGRDKNNKPYEKSCMFNIYDKNRENANQYEIQLHQDKDFIKVNLDIKKDFYIMNDQYILQSEGIYCLAQNRYNKSSFVAIFNNLKNTKIIKQIGLKNV